MQILNNILSRISIQLIKLYQLILSPDTGIPSLWLKGRVCRHEPHCSQYALEHINRFGFFKSIIPIMDRVSNCTAGHGKIIDPVPKKATSYQPGFQPGKLPATSKTKTNDVITKQRKQEAGSRKPLRIIFFGSGIISMPFFLGLYQDKRFEIVGVVCPPDQPSDRGQQVKPNLIKAKALELGISTIATPQTLRLESKKYPGVGESFYTWIKDLEPDYLVVMSYGKIIPEHILDAPKLGPINIHPSLLPKYRGPTPPQTTLLNGDLETGISIMKMAVGLDEGDIISVLPVQLTPITTFKDFIEIINNEGPKFLNETLINYAQHPQANPQDHSKATYTKKIEKEDGLISLDLPLEQVLRRYNAYYLWPKIYFIYQGKRIIIDELEINLAVFENSKSSSFADSAYILNPAIEKLLIKPEGKKAMKREEWKRGNIK